MAVFTPKRVQVPGLLSEDGLAVAVKELTRQSKDVAQARVPDAAVEFATKVADMGQRTPGDPKLSAPAPAAPQGIPQSAQPSPLQNALQNPVARALGAFPLTSGIVAGAEALGRMGTLAPEEQEAEHQQQLDSARAQEQALKAETEADRATREALEAMTDEEWAAATGLNPLTRTFGSTGEEIEAREQASLQAAQETVQAAEKGPLPTQRWWLNALQVATRSAAQMGTDALHSAVDVYELLEATSRGGDTVDSPMGKVLDQIDKALDAALPGDPSRSREFVTKLSSGAGSMIGFLIAGYAGRAFGLSAGATSGALGAAVQGHQQYEDAERFSATTLQKALALIAGAVVGASEAIPIDRAFMRAEIASGGLLSTMLRNTAATSAEEFIQEFGQAVGQDFVARYIYDENREFDPGSWLEQGVIGAILGAGSGALTSVTERGTAEAQQAAQAAQDAALQEQITRELQEGRQRFNALLGEEAAPEAAQPESAGAPAPTATAQARPATPRPEPVRGDAIQQLATQDIEQQVSSQRQAVIDNPNFRSFFAGSQVVDASGAPMVVYHATTQGGSDTSFSEFRTDSEMGAHFGTASQATDRVSPSWAKNQTFSGARFYPVYLSIKNPLRVPDIGNFSAPYLAPELVDMGVITQEEADKLSDENRTKDRSSKQYTAALKALLQKKGYDGLVYLNRAESVPSSRLADLKMVDADNLTDEAFRERVPEARDSYVAFEPTQIKSAIANIGTFDPGNANIDQQVATPVTREQLDEFQLPDTALAPLPSIEKGLTGPIPMVVKAAKAYAAAAGIPHRRQRDYVRVNVPRAERIAQAYDAMEHAPNDPAVQAAYKALAEETIAQYRYVLATGIKIESMKEGQADPYETGPREVLKDIANGHIWYFPTKFGFGSDATFDPTDNPLLAETEFNNDAGETMLVNDLFRVVHDFFGHGLEGSGFGPRGEENAWQSHMRLFTAEAVPAMTSETRGQNSWVNYGPHGEHNRTSKNKKEETIYANQKTGLLPEWAWTEGVADSRADDLDAPVELRGLTDAEVDERLPYLNQQAVLDADPEYAALVAEYERLTAELNAGMMTGDQSAEPVSSDRARELIAERDPVEEAIRARQKAATATASARGVARAAAREPAAQRFHDAFAAAKAASKFGSSANLYSAAEYSKMRTFLTPDGLSGFALDGEDIVSVFSHPDAPRGRVRTLIDTAVANGGRTLDAFDGKLVQMYSALGFHETSRVAFDRSQAPEDWPYDLLGEPDIVFMAYGPDVERMEQRESALTAWHKNADPFFKNEDGTPKLFYHGTEKGGFRVFSMEGNWKTQGTGAWFTDSRRQASTYSGARDDVELVQPDRIVDELLAKGATRSLSTDFVLRREEDGYYIELDAGYSGRDGPFNETELREWVSDWADEGGPQRGVYTIYINAQKPLIVDWGGAAWMEGPAEQVWNLYDPRNGDPYAEPVETFYEESEARDRMNVFLREIADDLDEGDVEYFTEHPNLVLKEEQGRGYQTTDEFVRELRENGLEADGYDAVVLLNVSGSGHYAYANEVANEVIVFDPTKIKSTANIGTYSPTDPDILRMTGTAAARAPYKLEPTRPARGIPLPQGERTSAELQDLNLAALSEDFTKLLDLTVRQGRLAAKNRNVMGEFNRTQRTIRLRTWSDLSTRVHEGGHALNDMHATEIDNFIDAHRGQVSKIAHALYGGDLANAPIETVLREGFAEFFRVYGLTPEVARNRWAGLTSDFEATLDGIDPRLRTGLNDIAGRYDKWLKLPSSQVIENDIADSTRYTGITAAAKELRDKGFKSLMREYAIRATKVSVDRMAPLREYVSQLLNVGEANRGAALDLKMADDPRVLFTLAGNSGNRAGIEVTDGVTGYRSVQAISRGLQEAMLVAHGVPAGQPLQNVNKELMRSFNAYLVTRRALDEWRRYDAQELDRPPTQHSRADHEQHRRDAERLYPQFVRAAEIVHEYGMAMWRKRYEAGLLDKETYQEGLKRQFYAPLHRDVSDRQGSGADSVQFGSSILTKGPRFRGSDRKVIEPFTMLMQMTYALERQIAENDSKKALAVLADRAGTAGALVERIPANQLVGATYSVGQVARQLTGDLDLTETDAADLMTVLEGSIERGDMMTLFRSQQASAQGENVIFFWENGKVAAIRLANTEIAADVVNLMNGLGRESVDLWVDMAAMGSTVFRSAITKWPDFLIVNFVRDQIAAWLQVPGYVPFVSGIRGMVEEVRQKEWAKQYNLSGAIFGGMSTAALHRARVNHEIEGLKAQGYIAKVFGDMDGTLGGNLRGAIKGFAQITELSETASRLGAYRATFERAKAEGLTDYEASIEAGYVATDLINFGLHGSRMMAARRLVPFLNAALQGMYKAVRTLGGGDVAQRKGLKFALTAYFKNINNLPLSRAERNQLHTGRRMWALMTGGLGLFSAVLAFLFRDDEDYQGTSEYLRATGWVIPLKFLGGKAGEIAYIPKPFELALFANAVERGIEFGSGDPTAPDRFLRGAAQLLVPPTDNPVFQTALELGNNIDLFTGREIVPTYMQGLDPRLQYSNYTSSFARWLGDTTGWSPMLIDHAMSGFGASAYRDLATIFNAADPNRPAPAMTDLPIIRRFFRDARRGSVSAQDFWAQASQRGGALERNASYYKHEIDAGNEQAANRYLATLDSDSRAYAVLMTHYKASAKRLNPFYRGRQVTGVISALRRELNGVGIEDTTVVGENIPRSFMQMGPGMRREVDEVLSELARREVRNTLVASGEPGWADKKIMPIQPTLDLLLATSPEAYDEYVRRYRKAKIYDDTTVYENWADARSRLLSDGYYAVLDDLVTVASAGL